MTGTTTCAVGERDGQVVLTFPLPVEWATFDPETARQIGEAMAREAYKAKYGRSSSEKGSVISEQIRTRLISRVTIIIRSMQNKQKLPGYIAAEVVDSVLQEVT